MAGLLGGGGRVRQGRGHDRRRACQSACETFVFKLVAERLCYIHFFKTRALVKRLLIFGFRELTVRPVNVVLEPADLRRSAVFAGWSVPHLSPATLSSCDVSGRRSRSRVGEAASAPNWYVFLLDALFSGLRFGIFRH